MTNFIYYNNKLIFVLNRMDYNKCFNCSRIDTLAKSGNNDAKIYTDCWLCNEAASFVVSDVTKSTKKE